MKMRVAIRSGAQSAEEIGLSTQEMGKLGLRLHTLSMKHRQAPLCCSVGDSTVVVLFGDAESRQINLADADTFSFDNNCAV